MRSSRTIFSGFESVLDLGDGYAGVLCVLLAASPRMAGALCARPYLAEPAARSLKEAGVGERARFVAGDFFESVPGRYDAYVMRFIVHDALALKILCDIHRAATPGSTLIRLEQVVLEELPTAPAHQAVIPADLARMIIGRRERTIRAVRALLKRSGGTLTRVVKLASEFPLLETKIAGGSRSAWPAAPIRRCLNLSRWSLAA